MSIREFINNLLSGYRPNSLMVEEGATWADILAERKVASTRNTKARGLLPLTMNMGKILEKREKAVYNRGIA
jgi:hypothetical protein